LNFRLLEDLKLSEKVSENSNAEARRGPGHFFEGLGKVSESKRIVKSVGHSNSRRMPCGNSGESLLPKVTVKAKPNSQSDRKDG